ncbi:hypothetical protein OG949_23850 [Streptomyces scopuliridis]|uniref:hypothetical protein n=1 Tax=Streptomyces scopuliridis TaxID=452529 RepID=UPI002DD985F8|nr:hypothetical protein [Streptomyces scopuliridis]WSB35574.1 hypothetical protein OG949_23850 [Streptomyces scopuliridis]
MARHAHGTRAEYLDAAREEEAAGNTGLASLLAEEAEYCGNAPSENARVMRDFPGGQRRED